MTTYDLGDGVPLRYEARTAEGVLVSTTVDLTVTKPDGSTVNPAVTETSTGIYDAVVVVDQKKTWFFDWNASGVLVDVAHGQFDVADPAPPAYAGLEEFKAMRRRTADTVDDALLQRALNSASRQIDRKTERRFWLDPVASPRTFDPCGRTTPQGLLLVDDIGVVDDDLLVETGSGSSWSAVEGWEAWPDNALDRGDPVTGVVLPGPYWRGVRVRITARWGWPAVPEAISMATLLLASRLYLRKDSPEGVTGSEQWGMIRLSRWDPDVEALVAPYIQPKLP